MYRRFGKRAFDLVLSAAALVFLAPLLLLVAICVRCFLGAPVLFRQQRPGLLGRPFTVIKFRTMLLPQNKNGQPLDDAARLTAFGRFLRSTSLDELPELVNVLRGEMSLVGPRPLLMHYLDLYSPEQMRRHDVRPGLTGWAQVVGRNATSWEQRFAHDVWYVDHVAFGLDLKIVFLTLKKVFLREGITAEGHATMAEFRGNTQ
ncbi:MAG TPA: sugar transferase [Chthoniobacterales bacterium]|nr:sugar transferase [Chthoniobacterales bacterium]